MKEIGFFVDKLVLGGKVNRLVTTEGQKKCLFMTKKYFCIANNIENILLFAGVERPTLDI